MQALAVSRGYQFQRIDLERRIGEEPFESAILVFKSAQLCDVTDLHTAKFRFPSVKRHRADAMLAAQVGRFGAGLCLFEDADELLFGKARFLQRRLLTSRLTRGILYF